jgi:hypothetical protein
MKNIRHFKFFNLIAAAVLCLLSISVFLYLTTDAAQIEINNDKNSGKLTVLFDGQPLFAYQYSHELDLTHFWPLFSPSNKNMLIQKAEPFPHHRSFWFADTVRLENEREVSLYYAYTSGQKIGENAFGPPFRDHIKHIEFTRLDSLGKKAIINEKLLWEMDGNIPVLQEYRKIHIHSLGNREYLIDITFILTASYGDVFFLSDTIHYAWPFLRMHPDFSEENGGTIASDNGACGEEATDMKTAKWIDYSNTVEGVTEGLAVFQWPDGYSHKWLTREYGCFGPRRPEIKNGNPFTLIKGDSISQRVGIYVHKGDAKSGKVKRLFEQYINGKFH